MENEVDVVNELEVSSETVSNVDQVPDNSLTEKQPENTQPEEQAGTVEETQAAKKEELPHRLKDGSLRFPVEMGPVSRTLSLLTKLSEHERANLADQVAKQTAKYDDLKEEIKALNSEKKNCLDTILALGSQVKNGECEKFVECDVVYDYPMPNQKICRRTDNGEIFVKQMLDEEKGELFSQNEAPAVETEEVQENNFFVETFGIDPVKYAQDFDENETIFFVVDDFEKAKAELTEEVDPSIVKPEFDEAFFETVKDHLCLLLTDKELKETQEDTKAILRNSFPCNKDCTWFFFAPIGGEPTEEPLPEEISQESEEIKAIDEKYGINIGSIVYEAAFVAVDEDALKANDIDPDNFGLVKNCLLIKANFNDIKDLFTLENFTKRSMQIAGSNVIRWYAFDPINK